MPPTMYLIDVNQTINSIVYLDDREGGIGFLDRDYIYDPMYDAYLVLVG